MTRHLWSCMIYCILLSEFSMEHSFQLQTTIDLARHCLESILILLHLHHIKPLADITLLPVLNLPLQQGAQVEYVCCL